jgi:hypothetical protein
MGSPYVGLVDLIYCTDTKALDKIFAGIWIPLNGYTANWTQIWSDAHRTSHSRSSEVCATIKNKMVSLIRKL